MNTLARHLPIIINEEYCWMHSDMPGGGGWSCIHPDCLPPAQQIIASLREVGYEVVQAGDKYMCTSPETGFMHEVEADRLLDQLIFVHAEGYKFYHGLASVLHREFTDEEIARVDRICREAIAVREREDATEKRQAINAG